MLKKDASGVLAILLCSRTQPYAPRAKIAVALLDVLFYHSLHSYFFVIPAEAGI